MKTLLLPVAGKSSRFPGMRPKWLLTMPNGRLMFEESLVDIDLSQFDRIILTCLKEHVEKYASLDKLINSARASISSKIEFLVLQEATKSHAETIYESIKRSNIVGQLYLKDCDNRFKPTHTDGNVVGVVDLNNIDLIDAKNKSYVEVDTLNFVKNIVEKSVISNQFCCGGYGFEDAAQFVKYYRKIKELCEPDSEIYVSHIIYSMLLDGVKFSISECNSYQDWGTIREYRHFCKQYVTVFCDVDGVLLENGSKFSKNGWSSEAIVENVSELTKLQREGRLYLVITTSRPKEEEEYVRKKLKELNLNVDAFLPGLPHAKRVLINDFSNTNPYPSAIAINLTRNSDDLSMYLSHIVD